MNINETTANEIYARYLELGEFTGWCDDDAQRVRQVGPLVLAHVDALIDDFYTEIKRHDEATKVITGGAEQIARLKQSLKQWLHELFQANYDRDYVLRRWKVGWRHVEIGLRQIYANASFSRLRSGILKLIYEQTPPGERLLLASSVSKALDLDQTLIQDAYESEKKLRSETAYQELVESAGAMIVILRDDHTVAFFNAFAQRITGYQSAAVIGKDFFDTFLPAHEQPGCALQLEQIMQGTPSIDYECQVICHDGTLRTLVWNARKMDDFVDSPAILAVGHDVTELKEVQQRALQAERLAAIGQTVAGLAHESRNAFQRMQAGLDMLGLEVEDQPEALELVRRIQRAQGHLHHLYEEVRSYAAPIVLERRDCDLIGVWHEVWDQLSVASEGRSVELRDTTTSPKLRCKIDPFAIGQVFRNIFENALAACPEKGLILLHAEETSLESHPEIVISIRDNGPGLSDDACNKVFAPFFTTKTKGTGLGMAIARRIVEAHDGQLTASNHPSGGAEFRLCLPVE